MNDGQVILCSVDLGYHFTKKNKYECDENNFDQECDQRADLFNVKNEFKQAGAKDHNEDIDQIVHEQNCG